MKPPTRPPNQFHRAGTLFCSCLLVVLLTWQKPDYARAQTVQRVAVKKDSAGKPSSPPPDGDSETNKAKAEDDSGQKKDGEKKKESNKADKKDAPEGVETKKEAAA